MSNVVEIKTRPAAIVEDVVDVLEKALASARVGDVISVAISMVNADRTTSYRWSEGDCASALVGAIARTAHRLNLQLDEGVTEIT